MFVMILVLFYLYAEPGKDCFEIVKYTKQFAKSQLALAFAETNIVFLKKFKARFLGFEFWQLLEKMKKKKKLIL